MKEETKLTEQEQIRLDEQRKYDYYVRAKPKQTLDDMIKLAAALATTGAYQKVEHGEVVLDSREIAGLSGCLHYEVWQEANLVSGGIIS